MQEDQEGQAQSRYLPQRTEEGMRLSSAKRRHKEKVGPSSVQQQQKWSILLCFFGFSKTTLVSKLDQKVNKTQSKCHQNGIEPCVLILSIKTKNQNIEYNIATKQHGLKPNNCNGFLFEHVACNKSQIVPIINKFVNSKPSFISKL